MLEEVVERQNMRAAYQQVKRNAGVPGIDGMSVEELGPYVREERQRIMEALLGGRYEPQPVKRVEIPKPGGGVRRLGSPTVVDRLLAPRSSGERLAIEFTKKTPSVVESQT